MIFRKVLLTSFVFNLFFIGGCRVQSSAEEFSDPRIETHYSPNENLEAFDNRLIRSAHHSVDICAFAFTDHELADALIAVAARGVKVRLYLDQGQTHGELAREERGGRTPLAGGTEDDGAAQMDAGVMQRLSATPNIEIRIKHSRTLMHLKSLFDRWNDTSIGISEFLSHGRKATGQRFIANPRSRFGGTVQVELRTTMVSGGQRDYWSELPIRESSKAHSTGTNLDSHPGDDAPFVEPTVEKIEMG
jgi:hypothetical protein